MGVTKKILTASLAVTMLASSIPLSSATVSGASNVPKNLTSIKYVLDNNTDGFANGTVTVTSPSQSLKDVDVVMYWADSNGNKLADYTKMAPFNLTGTTTTYRMIANTYIPEGAEKLIAYAESNGVYSNNYVSVDLPDNCTYKTDESKFLYEMQIVSDIHINPGDHLHNRRYLAMLNDIIKNSPDSVGIFVNGDIADHGRAEEYERLIELHNSVKGEPKLYPAVGNHDLMYAGNPGGQYQKFLTRINSDIKTDSLYFDKWVADHHYIFLGGENTLSDGSASLSDAQLAWLDGLLAEDTKKNPDKPVFIFLHQGLYESVAGTLAGQGWDGVVQETELKNILSKYGQAIIFAGHSHWDLYSERCMNSGSYNMPIGFNTASTAYLWTSFDTPDAGGDHADGSQGYYVRVYEDKVIFKGREFEESKWVPSALFVVEPQNISLDKSEVTLEAGSTTTVNATSSTATSFSYHSANPQIASVNSNGVIMAKNPGKTTISITANASDTNTIGRRNVEVTVTGNGLKLADLPYDFYGNFNYTSTYSKSTYYMSTDAENWAGAYYKTESSNMWRFTRTSTGAYKITFRGNNNRALKGSTTWVSTEPYSNNSYFHWHIFEDANGNYVLFNEGTWTNNGYGNYALEVNEDYSKKYLWMYNYTGGNTFSFKIGNVMNMENQGYAKLINYMGQNYYLNAEGAIATGWVETLDGEWHYTDSNGNILTGWIHDGRGWYYMYSNGNMAKGWIHDGAWYYLDSNTGLMQTGWVAVNGTWYYMNGSGAMQTGWLNDRGTWYYLDVSGAMLTGWQYVNGAWYYMNESGAMHTGWLYLNGTWYYLSSSGAMVTGGHWIGGQYYWFNSSGALA